MQPWIPVTLASALTLGLAVHPATADETPAAETAEPSEVTEVAEATDSMALPAGEEGTAFRSLTVEGENRVRVTFERPDLQIALDATQAPGLEWGSAEDVLNRTVPDLVTPLDASSAGHQSPHLAKPWLRNFREGAVRSFRPEVDGVERWSLTVADSRGETVTQFDGKGKPPKQLDWDGKTSAGEHAVVGLTYSFVLEAYDKAGNKRSFVGDGFTLPPYRRVSDDGVVLAFSGSDLGEWALPHRAAGASPIAPDLVLEAASWVNQIEDQSLPVRVTVSARSFDQADRLANRIVDALRDELAGDPARVVAFTDVRTDAPEAASVRIDAHP